MTVVLGGAVGAALFLVVFGPGLLDLTNVGWLMRGDSQWHFLGWHHFRYEAWQWPLGRISGVGFPVGTSVGNTDSIPLAAFLVKPFDPWLPDVAQYFGPWLFTCFVLQGTCAVLLLREVSRSPAVQLAGASLFVLLPALAHRTGHAALTGHWLLIAALWLVLAGARRGPAWRTGSWMLLCGLAGLVHPYLSVMVVVLMVAAHTTVAWRQRANATAWLRAGLEVSAALTVTVIAWWQAGYFVVGNAGNLSAVGLGVHSMNLLAPVMPMGYSTLLPELRAATPGQYEGFIYFGVGWLALVAVTAVLLVLGRASMPRLGFVWLATLLLALLALSPVVTFGPRTVLDLSGSAPAALAMFRASGRFGWVGMYLTFAVAIAVIASGLPRRATVAVLLAAVVLQVVDLRHAYATIRARERDPTWTTWQTPLQSSAWDLALPHYRHVVLAPPDMCAPVLPAPAGTYPAFSLAAGRHHATINSGNAARYDLAAVFGYCSSLDADLRRGLVSDDSLYVLNADYRIVVGSEAREPLACGTVDGYAVCVTEKSYGRWREEAVRAGVPLTP